MINSNIFEEKGSDDGEPRGSAGLPILNELKRVDVVNVCVFIVRYYGGTKLGLNGLIHAYSETTRILLSQCKLLQWELKKKYIINHSYQDIGNLDFLIKKYNAKLLKRDFDLFVQSSFEINHSIADNFKNAINSKLLEIDSFIEIK
jgi:putative IMPACT (imprinted ancient) family translation regulator